MKPKKVVSILCFLLLTLIIVGCSRPVQREPVPSAPERAQQEQIPSATAPTGYYEGPIIDNHAHPIPPWVGDQNAYYDGLVRRMGETGVVKTALHRNAEWTRGYTSFSPEHDEWVLAAHERHPDRIIPYLGGFDPRESDAVGYVREQLQTGRWKGIGELDLRNRNSKTKIPANSPVMMEIYQVAAEFGVPVTIHYDFDYGVPPSQSEQELEDALQKNPDTTIIFAHSPPVRLMKAHPNLWAEISLFDPNASELLRNIYESERELLHRIVLCVTDVQSPEFLQRFPFTDRTFTYEELVDLARQELGELPQEFAQKVAYENLAGLLGITVPAATTQSAPPEVTTPQPTTSPAPQGMSEAELREPHYATPAVQLYAIQTAPEYEVSEVLPQPLPEPIDLILNPDGSLYAGSATGYSIKKVLPDGTVSTFTELHHPATTIAYSPTGQLFVGGFSGIWKVYPDGKVSLFSEAPTHQMVFAPDGNIYATERTRNYPNPGVIWKITPDGEFSVFNNELYWPDDIEVSPAGELIVSDCKSGRIYRLNASGKATEVAQGFNVLDGIWLAFNSRGQLFVADNNFGISMVSLEDGKITPELYQEIRVGAWSDLIFDNSHNLFIGGTTRGSLYRVSPQGEAEILVSGYNSYGLTVGTSGELYIADDNRWPISWGRILRLDVDEDIAVVIDGLRKTWDVAVDDVGNLFVADNHAGAPGVTEEWRVLKVTPHGDMTVLATNQYDMTIRWGPGPESFPMMSIAVEPSTQDLFVFVGRPDKIYRITQEGVIVELPTEFEKDVFNADLAFADDGNLFALVVYSENYNVGPLVRRLFRIDKSSGELTLVANLDAALPNNEDDFAVMPTGDIIMLTRGVVGPDVMSELVKITPTGERSRIAWHLPIDPLSMAVSPNGDIFFTCATGIFKVSPR